MSVIIPPGVSLVAWRFTCSGDSEEMLVTCGVEISGGALVAAAAAADAFQAAFPENTISQDYTFRGCRAALGQDGGPPVVAQVERTYQGSADPARLVPNTAILIRKITAAGGRHQRGRMYLPPLWHEMGGGNVSASGDIGLDVVDEIQTAVDAWLMGLEPRLLHDETAPSNAATDIVAVSVQAHLATQRRRLRP